MRFTLFDLVVYRRGKVREAWAKYGRQTWRYFGVVLLASFVFLILIAAAIGPFFIHMLKTMKGLGVQGPNANPWPIMAELFPLIGIGILIGLAWIVVDAVLQDFVLPPMALEDASIEGAFGRFFAMLRDDFGSVLVYLLLRFVVALGISWVLLMVVFVVLMIVGLGALGVGFGLYHAMWNGGVGMQVVFVAAVAAMALALLAIYLLAMIAVYGTAAVFKESYAAYFFGSRYSELGNALEPPMEDLVGVRIEPPLPPMPPFQEPPPVW
jgi:MFS family permease